MAEIVVFMFSILGVAVIAAYEIAYIVREKGVIAQWFRSPLKEFVQNPHRVIITVLFGINLFSVLAAVVLTRWTLRFGQEGIAVLVAGTLTTFFVVFFGEILPKSIARLNPDRYIRRLTPLIYGIYRGFQPLVHVVERVVYRNLEGRGEYSLTDEIEALLWKGRWEKKDLDPDEFQFLERTLHFFQEPVKNLMIPIRRIFAVEISTPPKEVLKIPEVYTLERFPVYRERLDQIAGIVHIKDLFGVQEHDSLEDFLRPVAFVFRDWTVDKVVQQMRKEGVTFAVVVDEFGNAVGMVNLDLILEGLTGEAESPHQDRQTPGDR